MASNRLHGVVATGFFLWGVVALLWINALGRPSFLGIDPGDHQFLFGSVGLLFISQSVVFLLLFEQRS